MFKDSIYSLSSRLCNALGKFISFLLVARSIGVEGYGVFVLYISLSTIFATLSLFGYNFSIININSKFRNKGLVNTSTLIYSIILCIVSFLLVYAILLLFVESETALTIALLSTSQVTYFIGTSLNVVNLKLKNTFYASLVINLFFVTFCIFSSSDNLIVYLFMYALSRLIALPFFFSKVSLGFRIRHIFKVIKIQLGFGKNYLFFELNNVFHHRFDFLILSLFASSHSLGIYGMIKNIIEGLMYLPKAIQPIIIRELSKDRNIGLRKILSINTFIYALIFLVFITLGKTIIDITYGSQFINGYAPLLLSILGGYFYSLAYLLNSIQMGQNMFRSVLLASTTTSVSIVITSLVFIPILELNGSVIAFIVSSLIYFIIALYKLRNTSLPRNGRVAN